MRILISGYCGQMGREIARLAAGRNIEVACGVDVNAPENDPVCVRSFDKVTVPVDCVVDFSFHTNAFAVTDFAVKNNLPLAMGTTGLTQEEKAAVEAASEKIPVLFTSNFSLGVALMNELVKIAARVMPDTEIEIIEAHHNRKADAPSGTAATLAESIISVRPELHVNCGRSGMCKRQPDEIGVNSIRMGNIGGMHEVMFGTENQTITIKHEAHSRSLFAEGALSAAVFLCGKAPGAYTMQDLVEGSL